MKQWITEKQFNELTNKQKKIWYKWIRKHHYTFEEIYSYIKKPKSFSNWSTINFPSIGEMIEYLKEKSALSHYSMWFEGTDLTEPSDVLWEAVKEILK